MAFYHTKDVRSVLLPATLIYWFVGMGIIEYPIGCPRTILSFLYSSAACTFHAVCAFSSYIANRTLNFRPDSRLLNVSRVTYYGSNVIIVGVIIVISIVFSKKRSRCIMELDDINGIIQGMGICRSYKRLLVLQIWQFGSLVVTTILLSFFTIMSSEEIGEKLLIFSKLFCLQYPYFISTVTEIIFCNFNGLMTGSFKDLNSLLESLEVKHPYDSHGTEDKLIQVNVASSGKLKTEILYCIRKIYTRLTRVAKHWNQIHEVFILAVVVFSMWTLTLRIFAIYLMLSLRGIQSIIETYFIEAFLEMMFFCGKLFLIVHSAVSLMSEARRTGGVMLKHLYPIASLRSEVRTFSMQLIQNPLDLSVLGLCSLDYSMLQQIFTTVVGYSVVLVQTIGPLRTN